MIHTLVLVWNIKDSTQKAQQTLSYISPRNGIINALSPLVQQSKEEIKNESCFILSIYMTAIIKEIVGTVHCVHNQTWSKTTQKIITPSWCQSCILPTYWLQDCTLLCIWAHYYFSYLYGHNVFQDNLSLKYDKRTMHRSVENRDGVNGTEIFSSSSNLRIWYTGTQAGLW